METTKRIMTLLIPVLLAAAPAQSMQEAAEQISNTRQAGCLVKITSDPAVFPLNIETIGYLLHSSGVGGKAAREVLDASPDRIDDYIDIDYEEWLDSDSDPSGSLGLPPKDFLMALSSGYEEGMDEYEYAMMMEMEMGGQPLASAMAAKQPSRGRSRSTSRPAPDALYDDMYKSDRRGTYDSYYMPPAPRRRMATAQVPAITADEETYLFSLQVHLPADVKPAAEEFMSALLVYLEASLLDAFESHRGRLLNQLEVADQEATRAEERLRNMQDELRNISGPRAADRNRILYEIGGLQQEIQRIEMEQDSHAVSIDATTKQIADIQAKLKEQTTDDTISRELQAILEMQRRHLMSIKTLVEAGGAPHAELADAEEKIARARIELAKRQEELNKSAGGNLIESLNRQLADILLQKAQQEVSLKNLEKQLSEAEKLLDKADDYEMLSLKADIARQNLREAILWRDRMTRRIRMLQRPVVSVIGAD
jgi:hypothetical protein